MTIAITRKISPRFNECEITHIDRIPINLDIAYAQHQEYVNALAEVGCQIIELPAEADLPDSVFVEDTAFILPEVAVITRPGLIRENLRQNPSSRHCRPTARLFTSPRPPQWMAAMFSCLEKISMLAFLLAVILRLLIKCRNCLTTMAIK